MDSAYKFPRVTFRLILSLQNGEKRWKELNKLHPKATLNIKLRDLEAVDIVQRSVRDAKPGVAVYYRLTDKGLKIVNGDIKTRWQMMKELDLRG